MFPKTLAFLLCSGAWLHAQTDDFNDGNDNGWARFNPTTLSSYSFPSGAWRMTAVATPDPGVFGPARVGAARPEVYDRFCVSVDITDWDTAGDASIGILARIQPSPSAGNLNCYAVTLNTGDADMGIELVTNEAPANISGGYADVALVPGHDYRLIFTGDGSHLEAWIYDLADPSVALASRSAEDTTYTRGMNGLVAFSGLNQTITTDFDNFSAAESDPAPRDNFNDGNDTGWTRHNPIGTGSFSLPNGGYRIASTASPDPVNFGPARAGSFLNGVTMSDFCVETDVVEFTAAEDTSLGLLARVTSIGAGTLNGYSLTYQTQDSDLEINRINGEQPTNVARTSGVTLDPAHRYRMVFAGRGDRLQGWIYDLTAPLIPVVTVSGSDTEWTTGAVGYVVFSDGNTAASATFDTFSVSNGSPPALSVRATESGPRLWWSRYASLCHTLQRSRDLTTWESVPDAITMSGRIAEIIPPFVAAEPKYFYRLALLPQ